MNSGLPPLPVLRPMDAVAALYSGEDAALSHNILAHLSRSVFHGPEVPSAGPAQRLLSKISYRLLKATTRRHASDGTVYWNDPGIPTRTPCSIPAPRPPPTLWKAGIP
jgi:hypothetical protein